MKMNSPEDLPENGIDQAESPSCSRMTDENSNSSVKTPDESKGAIPKTSFSMLLKKNIKVNNNVEDIERVNGVILFNSEAKTNGFLEEASTPVFISTGEKEEKGDKVEMCTSKRECSNNDTKCNSSLSSPLESDLLFAPLNEANCTSCRENSLKSDSDTSSEDNEILSVSDDGCIYTYKGDNDDGADLPSSFFNLELPPLEAEENQQNRNNASSPEMDFLEMDFDPGPSGDADSDTTSNADVENTECTPSRTKNNLSEEPKPCCSKTLSQRMTSTPSISNNTNNVNDDSMRRLAAARNTEPSNSHVCSSESNFLYNSIVSSQTIDLNTPISNLLEITHLNRVSPDKAAPSESIQDEVKMPWSCTLLERTKSTTRLRRFKKHHSPRGDIMSPNECSHSFCEPVIQWGLSHGMVMIWSEKEACMKQISQIGPSSCGATAVLNVLNALRFPLPSLEKVQEYVGTKFRANTASLTEYLLSRSKAGCDHQDIMLGLYRASEGKVYSRFFAMYPERLVNMYKWLSYWINIGAVPVATLNLQRCEGSIPDSWHHQMIFGVDHNGVYLTNPVEFVNSNQLWPQLISESVLLVRRDDVISRFNVKRDMQDLMAVNDERWKEINVVGQVAHIIRENRRPTKVGFTNTSHIKIPASYKAGIVLACEMNSPAYQLLHQCPELPLLPQSDEKTNVTT